MPADLQAQVLAPREVLLRMFRACQPDALVAFGSRRPGRYNPELAPRALCVLSVSELVDWLPGIDAWGEATGHTQYQAQNTLRPSALLGRPLSDQYKAIQTQRGQWYAAKGVHLRELASIVLDLDVGRDEDDLTGLEALAIADRKRMAGELPAPTMFALSGRGAYLWYSLVQDRWAPEATEDNRQRWKLVVKELLARTADLKSDPKAASIINWYKLAGTRDWRTGNRVDYFGSLWGVDPATGEEPRYTLPELVDFLGLHMAPDPPVRIPARRPPALSTSAGRGKFRGPHRKRAEEMVLLAVHRRGIRIGHRHSFLHHYFWNRRGYLTWCYRAEGETNNAVTLANRRARDEMGQFNTTYCEPPQPAEELPAAFQPMSWKTYRPTRAYLAAELGVTVDEADELDLVALAPEPARTKREHKARAASRAAAEMKADTAARIDALLLQGVAQRKVRGRLRVSYRAVVERRAVLKERGELPARSWPKPPASDQGNLPV